MGNEIDPTDVNSILNSIIRKKVIIIFFSTFERFLRKK